MYALVDILLSNHKTVNHFEIFEIFKSLLGAAHVLKIKIFWKQNLFKAYVFLRNKKKLLKAFELELL